MRVFALGAICVVVAAVAPAAPLASDAAWVTTPIPQATLQIGKGLRVSALSLDGRVAVVADPRAVDLFQMSSESSWSPSSNVTARLQVPGSALANLSAVATSADGTTVLVAAGAVGGTHAAVYVFHVSSPRAWQFRMSPIATLSNAADPTGFGSGVALSADGTTALVGEPGRADVFHVADPGSWRDNSTPTATLLADPVGAQVGGVSTAVALSADGTTALIGATSDYTSVGAASIFRASAEDGWVSRVTPDAVLTDGLVGSFGDGFGRSVALAPDGMTALVGAPNLAVGPSGAAYFFQVRAPNDWTSTSEPDTSVERASATAGGGRGSRTSGDVPGWSVALSEAGTALVGDPSLLGRPGAADLLHVAAPERSWRLNPISHVKLTDAGSPPRSLFGATVAISSDGTTALVSSARSSFIYTQSGSGDETYCYVPYVEGEALRAARRAIESTHCRDGKVTSVGASRAGGDRVISQRPEPGERLAAGSRVALTVSNGRHR